MTGGKGPIRMHDPHDTGKHLSENPSRPKILIFGGTGHVGSKVAIGLAERGMNVTAVVREDGARIRDPYTGNIDYVVADLTNESSIRRAVSGMDIVFSSANGILPQKKGDNAKSVNIGAVNLIHLCEEAGVSRFVQSSVPVYKHERHVPELWGKRLIEARLEQSSMQTIVIRNAAFMDVFIPMGGFAAGQDASVHATTKRNFDFAQRFMAATGHIAERYGLFLAPGGAHHGTPIISTRDVAEMMIGGILYDGTENLLIEAGGPEWLTWGEIADKIGRKIGRKKLRVIPMPAWLLRINKWFASPFSPAAANMFALMSFVADYQPRWEKPDIVERFQLPSQLTVADYINANYNPVKISP